MKIKLTYILIAFFVIAAAIAGMIIIQNNNKTEDEIAGGNVEVNYEKLDDVVFKVQTADAFTGDLVKTTKANGLVRAARAIEVTSKINSVVEKVNIFEGKKVQKGDLLLKLDDREFKILLNEADDKLVEARVEYYFLTKYSVLDSTKNEAALAIQSQLEDLEEKYKNNALDEAVYSRLKDSLDLQLIFTGGRREDLIMNKSGISRAQNAKERALLDIEYTEITAPFGGVIGDFHLSEGQRISSGEKLFKLIDNSELLIDVGILENEVAFIEKGNKVEVEISALPDSHFEGTVLYISPYVDEETRTSEITVKLKNPSAKVKPGMFASVSIETQILEDRLLVPKEALLVRDKRNLVFRVEDSLAKWVYVDIGEENDEFLEIKNGINAGDEIIIEGQYTLAHDAKIDVVNE